MDNNLYKTPTRENVAVRDILVQKMDGGIRYLNIVDKTDYSVIALSQDQNFESLCPFEHFNEVIIIREDDSLLVGENADKSVFEEVVALAEVKRLIKRAYSERDLVDKELLYSH